MHRVALDDGRAAIVKRRRNAPPGFFVMEAHGLALLRATGTLRVPEVYSVADGELVIEDLGSGHAPREALKRAGRDLARLHAHTAPQFGLDRDGWCGDNRQRNSLHDDGFTFFADCRLRPQARLARNEGRLGRGDLDAIERLCRDLPSRIPVQRASLVHGDLWTGNLHACADGELALIDAAAVHYGWAEADLAMLTLFGSPPAVLFAAYEETSGIDAGWRERAPLYNLYHLLNHLNLFGGGYLGSVRDVLRRA